MMRQSRRGRFCMRRPRRGQSTGRKGHVHVRQLRAAFEETSAHGARA